MDTPYTVKEIQKSLLDKSFSCVDLVDSFVARIDKHNEDLNIFLTVTAELAYEKAKFYDKVLDELGFEAVTKYPLLGAVVSYKDIFMTKGVRTTAGSRVLESYVPQYSGTAVKKLEEKGAIMIGKTNCDAWAHGASGENSDFGPTKNPWNRGFIPGGSSSGSGSAVASGMSVLSLGTDTGGSIRQPANFCGVVGLKPTYGAVSRYGVIAMASSLDTVGGFALNIEDVELMFNSIKGEDGFDATVVDGKRQSVNGKLTIGVPKEYFVGGLDKEVEKEVEKVIEIYKKLGIEVKEVSLPHTKYAISVYYIIQPAEVSSNLGRYDGIRYGRNRDSFGAEAKRRIMLGTFVLSSGYYDAYYLNATKVRTKIIEDFSRVFEKKGGGVDALIAPVSPTPAFKLGEKGDDPLKMYLADVFTAPANLAGIPGISIPSGFTRRGLPLGFQILGPRFSEQTLFELGKAFHEKIEYKPAISPK